MPTFRQRMKPRIAILGGIVMTVLLVLLIRLWSMQVVNGATYAAQAESNRVRTITTIAPRGRILDRNGKPLVTNRATLAVVVQPSVRDDDELLTRLSNLLSVPLPELMERVNSVKEAALAPRVVAIDVPLETVAYLSEHESEFPGVEVQTRAIREYPQGKLAAHVLGYTGEISDSELAEAEFSDYDPTDIVGKAGAERAFESVLQGDRGVKLMEVNASGEAQRVIKETDPEPGRDVVLTLDIEVQKITEKALQDALREAHKQKFTKAKGSSAVVLDVKSGEVLAMASTPTYDPSVFLGGISNKEWRSLTSTSSEFPLTNRAIMGQYPAASTFKAFIGMAGLQEGITRQWATYRCAGYWTEMGDQWGKWCWKHSGHGIESLMDGIADSCDVVFYEIGYKFYKIKGEPLQASLRSWGFGKPLGIELPGEASGRVPDAAWKKAFNENYPEYQQWLPGDTVNMSIGQGDLLVTPLQIGSTYAGIANNGKVMQPHVLRKVLGSDGSTVIGPTKKVVHTADVSKRNVDIMDSALRGVTTQGTAGRVFRGFPIAVSGKTGTAQIAGKDDFAWFVAYAPASDPKYCVVVAVEQGGHGGSVAAPATREILSVLFDQKVEYVTAEDNSR